MTGFRGARPEGRGFFVTVEGPEGSGKTTQTHLLKERLESRGERVVLVREPGGTRLGEAIRPILLAESGEDVLCPEAELMLFLAARAQLVSQVIEPALRDRKIVICDRYADSTVAYQAFGRGLERGSVEAANLTATRGLEPDLTVLLDMDVSAGLERVEAPNRFDSEAEEFHLRVRSGFLQIAAEEPGRVKVIDASGTKDKVAAQVWGYVESALLGAASG